MAPLATYVCNVNKPSCGQDTSTLAVIETPPSETWQLAFHPTADELLLAAAGGSGNKIVVWAPEEQVCRQELPLPEVGLSSDAYEHAD